MNAANVIYNISTSSRTHSSPQRQACHPLQPQSAHYEATIKNLPVDEGFGSLSGILITSSLFSIFTSIMCFLRFGFLLPKVPECHQELSGLF